MEATVILIVESYIGPVIRKLADDATEEPFVRSVTLATALMEMVY
jgi:hypothetical protein